MKKLLLLVFVLCCVFSGYGQSVPADDILAYVRTKLPSDPLKLTGSLKVRTEKGFTKSSLPVEMELDWGAATPSAIYRIGGESLEITWKNDQPDYLFSNKRNTPTSKVLDTGITWADLSFSVLWWPNSKLVGEEKKINRECYVVDVPVPGSENTMRLWIEKNMGMLLEAQTLDTRQKEIRRMRIKSIKKMDGMWIAKDLEIDDRLSGNETTLQISDLEWKNPKPTAEAFDPAVSVNRAAFDLYNRLAAQSEGNLFLSPYSISSALAMVYGGAYGETEEQIKEVLHFGGQEATHPAFSVLRSKLNGIQQKGHVELNVANSLWPQKDYSFLPDYLSMTRELYGSEIMSVDFKGDTEGSRQQINGWAEEQTNERIKNLIPQGALKPSTRLVLANAIYFKGKWASQFKTEYTHSAPFTLMDGNQVNVPMMAQTSDFKLASTETLQALELPYEGEELSMLVLLSNTPGKLPAIDNDTLTALQFTEQELAVQLPKFKIESQFELGQTLAEMGMPLAFSDRADFSGMTGSRNLFIGSVAHKAFVEVNEEGTEAAAATGVLIAATSMPPQFIANRPFLFLIRENSTGTILFIGRVADPR